MNNPPADIATLLDFMSCEQISRDLYIGQSKDLNTGQVFGGQVLGQAIKAASSTVDASRGIRSAHAYFIRKGDVNEPIIYNVDRALDGGSVSSRIVGANQHGKQILHLSASFHAQEEGLDYNPVVTLPVGAIVNDVQVSQEFSIDYLDIVKVKDADKTNPDALQYWIKTKEKLPDEPQIHQASLAYISDLGLLFSALVPHGLHDISREERSKKLALASIDHAIWFHRSFRADEWFFYDCRVVSTSGARGLSRGSLYDRNGNLFASTTQEGLLRLIK